MLEGFADLMLRMLGDDPIQYYSEDKWPVIFADITHYLVPYGQILLFLLPFLVIKLSKKQYTKKNIIIASVIGIVLAIAAYVFDWYLLAYGQGAVFNAIYGS